jgi:hypothetical protein
MCSVWFVTELFNRVTAKYNQNDSAEWLVVNAIDHSFSTIFNPRHVEKGAKIVKAHHQFLRRVFIIKKTSNKIVFKSSIAKILITVLFLKNNVDHGFPRFFFYSSIISRFFSAFHQTPAAHLRALRSHMCAAAHRFKFADLDVYSGGAWFESRLGWWLSRLRFFMVLLSPSRQMAV